MNEPNYDAEIAEITGAFRRATRDIQDELSRIDIENFTYPRAKPVIKRVGEILADLFASIFDMIAGLFSKAANDGVKRAMDALGEPGDPKLNRPNANMVAAMTEDTQADLLAVTQNVDRRTKVAIRRAVSESMRGNMAAGINGRRSINRDSLAGIRKALDSATSTGIIDAAGRRWKPEVYADMVTRTKAMQANNEATINEALGRGVQYGVISRHGATDACRNWEGRVVKFTREAPGDYPYIGDISRRELFHPACRHTISPVRNPDNIRRS